MIGMHIDRFLASVLAVCGCLQIVHAQTPERLFYYIDDSYETLVEQIGQIDVIAPVVYNVDEDGVVWGSPDPRVLELARAHDVGVMPLIHNPGFDQEMLTEMLADDEARARAVESMLDECRRYGYMGIQFDFENININDKDAFTSFYQETAHALRPAGFMLSIAVVHRPEKYPGPTKYFKWLFKNWRAAYDLPALAEAGDFISVMTYSQHTRRTPPGPNAGIPWVEQNIEYFLQSVPPEKLSLGIPVTTQHWSTLHDNEQYVANARSWSQTLKHPQVMNLLDRYNAEPIWLEDQGVSYAFFENGGLFEWVFIEDAASFRRKLELVKERSLRGFSVWVLGFEDPAIWDSIR